MKLSPLKSLLLAAVATAALAGPIAADAQPAPDRAGDREQTQADRKARQEARQKQRAERAAQPNGPAAKGPGANGPARVNPGRPDRPGRVDVTPARPDRPVRANQPDRVRPNQPDRVRPNRPNQPQTRPAPNPRPQANPAGRRALTPERVRVRRNAQTQIQRSFNRSNWQSRFRRSHPQRNWWRNDRRFRGWNGIRVGFYFAPGFGYYNVPRQYYNRHYYAGSYLPSFFWRYQVSDYNYWGLPPAPPGTAWIYVNNWILLVDLWDGYIIEAIPDAWAW